MTMNRILLYSGALIAAFVSLTAYTLFFAEPGEADVVLQEQLILTGMIVDNAQDPADILRREDFRILEQ